MNIDELIQWLHHSFYNIDIEDFEPCTDGCGRMAKPGGICAHCATEKLAEFVGPELAINYRDALRHLARISTVMRKNISIRPEIYLL